MKKPQKTVLSACLLCLSLILGFTSNAQTINAKLDKATQTVTLDKDAAFGYLYHIDISKENFASKEEAKAFFKVFNSELVNFVVYFDKGLVSIILSTRAKPTWMTKEWNQHIAENKSSN